MARKKTNSRALATLIDSESDIKHKTRKDLQKLITRATQTEQGSLHHHGKETANLKVGCGLLDFSNLKLIELPDAPANSMLKDTLEGWECYLTALPLKAPNVNHRVPKSMTVMVNILSDTTAEGMFAVEEQNLDISKKRTRMEGVPSKIYEKATAPLMRCLVKHIRSCPSTWCARPCCLPRLCELLQEGWKDVCCTPWTLVPDFLQSKVE